MAHVTLILGGARSGKSAYALSLCPAPHTFIATAEALDDEMTARITAHQAERNDGWDLVEAPLNICKAITDSADENRTLLIDCLTLWLSNLMHHNQNLTDETNNLIAAMAKAPGNIVLVSNEVGMGLSPDNALGRSFRDEQGRLNQRIAAIADRVEFVAAGLPLKLK
ncbi:MAG: bifunctional adenosylcobinamide kinase/adenosylcobinamide-phosphate guanylyltransferase [Pikeienuella sp.]